MFTRCAMQIGGGTEEVLSELIPTMTSNTAPSGVCSASHVADSSNPAWRAFDKNIAYSWSAGSASSYPTAWIQYQFPSPTTVKRIIWQESGSTSRRIKSYNIQGSFDGSNWDTLVEDKQQTLFQFGYDNIDKSKQKAYSYYRINFTAQSNIVISAIQMYG